MSQWPDHFNPFPDYDGPFVCACGVRNCPIGYRVSGPLGDGRPVDVVLEEKKRAAARTQSA